MGGVFLQSGPDACLMGVSGCDIHVVRREASKVATLCFTAPQELTCREELLTLLLSLLPLVWKIPVREEKAPGGSVSHMTRLLLLAHAAF